MVFKMKEVAPEIIADTRESSLIARYLKDFGARVNFKMISPGDYIVAEGFAIERKTFGDFLQSIFDKRLFDQIERLSKAYPRHCLLVEGDVGYGLASLKNPLVFWGALSKIISDYGTPIVFTMNEKQSAEFIFSLAKKSQVKTERLMARYKPKVYSLAESQLLAVQGLPEVGPKMADRLLRYFKSVRRVFSAHPLELRGIEGIGKKKAEVISKFLDAPYLAPEKKSAK